MDDLISRQAAIDAVKFGITYVQAINIETGEARDLFATTNKELKKAVERINKIPSAERRGKKKVYYHGENTFSYVCDQCAMPIDGKDAFCRWCGAKMEV